MQSQIQENMTFNKSEQEIESFKSQYISSIYLLSHSFPDMFKITLTLAFSVIFSLLLAPAISQIIELPVMYSPNFILVFLSIFATSYFVLFVVNFIANIAYLQTHNSNVEYFRNKSHENPIP